MAENGQSFGVTTISELQLLCGPTTCIYYQHLRYRADIFLSVYNVRHHLAMSGDAFFVQASLH